MSCAQDENTSIPTNPLDLREWISVEEGRGAYYSLDSIFYFGVPGSIQKDSVRWILKEEILEVKRSEEHLQSVIVEKSISKDLDSGFVVTGQVKWDVFDDRWIKTESTVSLLEFPIPLAEQSVFEAASYLDPFKFYNIKGERVQIFKDWGRAHVNMTLKDSNNEPQRIQIVYVDAENQIERRSYEQRFSRDTGLIYSYKEIFDSQCIATRENCDELSWREKAEKGFAERKVFLKRL